MNNVQLIGRLTRDPELRYTQSGMAYARFTVAVNRRLSREKRQELESRNQPTADFIGCVAWGSVAENISNYFAKGREIAIDGRIQTGSYDKEDGTRVFTTDVVVNNFYFIGPSQNQGSGQNFNQSQGMNRPQPGPVNSAYGNDSGSNSNNDEFDGFYPVDNNIPF